MPDISSREWRWLAVASVCVLALINIPYVVAINSSNGAAHFSGFLVGLDDMYSYIAKMRFGARDGWAAPLLYTSDPHSGGYVYLQLVGLGKLAALGSGQGAGVSTEALIVIYHIARLLCGAILLVVVYLFVARFLETASQRRVAWLLAAIGGGFGWLQVFNIGMTGAPNITPVEYYVPEAFTILMLFGLPHVALARALLLAGWLVFFVAVERRSWPMASLAGLLWLAMSLCVPFFAGLLGIVTLAWLAAVWITTRRAPILELLLAALAGILPALYTAYNLWLFSTNPVFAAWSRQNTLPSPPLIEYLLAYSPMALMALPGAIVLVRRGLDKRAMLVIIWPVVSILMAYFPINVQRRLLEGLVIHLAILASIGIAWVFSTQSTARFWLRAAAIVLLTFSIPSTIFFILGVSLQASDSSSNVFHSSDELDALHWLETHARPDSIVFSTFTSGNLLPAYAPVRVYVGHGPETANSEQKSALAQQFFSGGMDDAARLVLLRENFVRYVWVGPPEESMACHEARCFDVHRLPLDPVFHVGAYTIYEVTP